MSVVGDSDIRKKGLVPLFLHMYIYIYMALASYFLTHFIPNLLLFTKVCYLKQIQGIYKTIIKINHHMNT